MKLTLKEITHPSVELLRQSVSGKNPKGVAIRRAAVECLAIAHPEWSHKRIGHELRKLIGRAPANTETQRIVESIRKTKKAEPAKRQPADGVAESQARLLIDVSKRLGEALRRMAGIESQLKAVVERTDITMRLVAEFHRELNYTKPTQLEDVDGSSLVVAPTNGVHS